MRPTLRAILLFVGGIPAALVPVLGSEAWVTVWVAYVAGAALALGVDALLAPGRSRIALRASGPATMALRAPATLEVTVDGARALTGARVEVLADLPADVDPVAVVAVKVPAGGAATVSFPLVPRRRGTFRVEAVWARWRGPLGLLERRIRVPVDVPVGVVPDLRPVRAAALRFFSSRDLASGSKSERYLGDGSEFESLRDHVFGMDPRTIDWKASARHRKLLSDEYRAERDHQVVLAIDTGRLMAEPLAGAPRLDHAIQAALLLGFVALRTGDRVGLHAFDERPRLWLPPVGGADGFPRLLGATAGLAYGTGETNFTLGLTDLATRLKRRSLVVVVTDFVDAVTAELMLDNVGRLVRRHLVLFVALSDPELLALAAAPPDGTRELHRAVAAAELLRDREVVLRRLRRLGARVLDARPADVSSDLVNAYLDAQRRELVG